VGSSGATPAGIATRGCDTQALLDYIVATAAAPFTLISQRHSFYSSSPTSTFLSGDLFTADVVKGPGPLMAPP